MTENFDALATSARDEPSQATMERLWGAVYALPQWYFVVRGVEQAAQPMIGVVDGKSFLLSFTDMQRADAFARRNGFVAAPESSTILALSPANVVGMAADYEARGVAGILFNDGAAGFFAPLGNLPRMWEYFARRAAPG